MSQSKDSPGVVDERDASGAAIETKGLTRNFGEIVAVGDVDLSVAAGVIFGLLGPNGAGKTTLIEMLTTILPPSAGAARVAGFDIGLRPQEVRRRIGYVPQAVSADGALTGYENLLLSAHLYGIGRVDRKRRILEALEFMGLRDSAWRLVREFSGGMIRRLEIAQSMLHRPAILFLDEPTVGLDPVARHAVWDRVRSLRGQYRATIFMTTHDMEEANILCERVAIMHRGRLAAVGSPEELKAAVGSSATLDDVFIHFTGDTLEEAGGYQETERTRRLARRLS